MAAGGTKHRIRHRRVTMIEFSRPVPLQRILDTESDLVIEATAEECRALASRFDLISLNRLRAEIRLRRVQGGKLIALSGRVRGAPVQRCVVTLVPVAGEIDESFSLLFAPSSRAVRDRKAGVELYIDPMADEPEPIEGESLDVGEVAAQQLALAIDPYPRAPGATLEQALRETAFSVRGIRGESGSGEPSKALVSPFAALAKLRRKPPKRH